jgi:hypothetical protein
MTYLLGDKNPSKRPEVRAKIGEASRERWSDPNFRKKMSQLLSIDHADVSGERNPNYGKQRPPEVCEKIRAKLKGQISPFRGIRRPTCGMPGERNPMYGRRNEKHPCYGKPRSEETRKKVRITLTGRYGGENNPNWRGGTSFEPYCQKFNNEFKERVREFWGRKCFLCGCQENGEKLHVHHVNYNKNTCCDSSPPLFIVLCRSCHARTNNQRDIWEPYLTEQILLATDGECYFPKVIACP